MEIMKLGAKLFYYKLLKMTDTLFVQRIQLYVQKLKTSSGLKI